MYWAIGAGRFLQTAGLFLLGLYIGRKELFVTSETHLRFWVKVLIIAAICFAPLYSLKEQIMASDNALIKQTVGTAFDMWQKFAFTFILVSSFVLLYQKECFRKAVSALRFYGKMSLTNYIAQSIRDAIIYFPFGLYLAPYCGYTISLLIGIRPLPVTSFILQMVAGKPPNKVPWKAYGINGLGCSRTINKKQRQWILPPSIYKPDFISFRRGK